ncbi:metal-dependent phosphohydrolase [Micromonospora sp. WMMD1082]|uniref:metal-dependent phosphohydrolase n=1 Tax=Micromonospora sp. WMMD1082 TaxID=3016104 RepID=UPI002415B06E|nr:metal-dependent phosphohydrolase [Micromonospora sp. WMMD1082]MDG4795103.1 metal-dependent phosphohydrolase [Micromonospora sp. WMMD1082]
MDQVPYPPCYEQQEARTVTVLATPRHPHITQALTDARTWCHGHLIDDRPALVHAVRVAVTLARHLPDPPPTLIAAALLHDAPDVAPDDIDLPDLLTRRYHPELTRIVYALHAEHTALDTPHPPIDTSDRPVLLISTADKIVAFTSLVRRAHTSGDPEAFFAARPALRRLLPHFHTACQAATAHVPATMATHLHHALTALTHAADPRC